MAAALAPWPSWWPSARAQEQPVRIGRDDAPSPVSDIEERVLREAFKRIGVPVQFEGLPLLRLIEMANDGKIDGDSGRIAEIAKRFPNLVLVPTPICRVDVAVYGRAEDFAKRTRSEIARMNIGIARGVFVLAKYSQGMKVVEAQNTEAITNMLVARRIDAAMTVYFDTEVELRGKQNHGMVRWPWLWGSEPLHCLLNRRHFALVPKLDEALAAMAREGLIRRYYEEEQKKMGVVPLLPADAAPR